VLRWVDVGEEEVVEIVELGNFEMWEERFVDKGLEFICREEVEFSLNLIFTSKLFREMVQE
jgi:hypothetical protein